jgi:phage terminase large subunit-like protein
MTGAEAMAVLLSSEGVIAEELARRSASRILRYFQADGPLRRELYPKHLEYFAAGLTHRERLLLAANRVGKTDSGAFESTLHLTGAYDELAPWWVGRRFDTPIRAWAAGDTSTTVRDILQVALLGPAGAHGTGMIPAHLIVGTTSRTGVPGAVESITVRHVSGGESVVQLRSYDQRREAFQGTSQHVVWLDEEPPQDILTECLLRTMDTPDLPGGGMLMLTFTPLMGLTPLILQFLPGGQPGGAVAGNRHVTTATWDDAPHLSLLAREELWGSIPPFQRDARSKGVPQLGSGAIYPVAESEITVADHPIPDHWPRCFGMDAGGGNKPTAAVWLAKNPDTQTWEIYSTYKSSAAEPVIHATAVKSRGDWIPGVGDCAALIMLEHDSRQLIDAYRTMGLDLELPDKAVETGIYDVWQLLSTGGLKVFASCQGWFEEYRLYRRDDKGRIVKSNDHYMDATRYAVRSGRARAKVKPVKPQPFISRDLRSQGDSWLR